MIAAFCLTNEDAVKQPVTAVNMGEDASDAETRVCLTEGGTHSERSFPSRTCDAPAILEAARALLREATHGRSAVSAGVGR